MNTRGTSDPLVSVILTTRDRPRLLKVALACYGHQTYPNRELIVVDDGDRFPADPELIEAAGGRLIRAAPGTILGTKLNLGIAEARGPLCQKMDDDDWYSPQFLETMVASLQNRQGVVCRPAVLFVSPFLFFDVARWEVRRSRNRSFPGATLMFARDSWEVRPFRALSQDEDVWFHRDQLNQGATSISVDVPEIFLAVRHAGSQRDRSHTWTVEKDNLPLEHRILQRPLHGRPEDLLPDWAVDFYRGLRRELLAANDRLAPVFRYIRTGVAEQPGAVAAPEPFTFAASGKLRAGVQACLSGATPRVLIVQNIRDGQGDEIIRCVPLMQALLDFHPRLEIVLLTKRAYLYAHPRVVTQPLAEPIDGRFDAVIDYFERNILEVNHSADLEAGVDRYIQSHGPRLVIAADKGWNSFTYHRVELDGHHYATELRLDRQRVKNVYETTLRLIAELGLPLRTGEQKPASEWVLAGESWPLAESEWQRLTAGNRALRPVAFLNPFGGMEPLKGYTASQSNALAALVRRLIAEGYFVIVTPNGTEWGSTAHARAAIDRLDAAGRAFTTIAPDAADAPDADTATRLLLYYVRFADLTVAVEGWAIHTAYCLGRPYRTLMMPYSHSPEWQPYAQSSNQRIDTDVPPLQFDEHGEFIVEQPRKQALLTLLQELGTSVDPQLLPFLAGALKSLDRDIRTAAARALARRTDPEVQSLLLTALNDKYYLVRAAAAEGLRTAGSQARFRAELEAHIAIGHPRRSWRAVLRLGHAGRPALVLAAGDEDPVVRREAASAVVALDSIPRPNPLRRALHRLLRGSAEA